jgi:arylsulfatase A-like enzyme
MKCSVRAVAIIGLVFAISMGFIDISISVFSRPSGLSDFLSVFPPLVVSIVFFFLAYSILFFLVAMSLWRFLRPDPISLALSLTLFLVAYYVLGLIKVLPGIFQPGDLIRLSVPILTLGIVSLLFSIVSYPVISLIRGSRLRNGILVFALSLPFLASETMVFVWFYVYRIRSFFSVESLLLNTGFISLVFSTLVLFYSMDRTTVIRLLMAFMIAVALGPLLTLVAPKGSRIQFKGLDETKHGIKSVVLITVDTLRADAISSYDGKNEVHTPNIDLLARDGVLFTNAFSPSSWTLPSVSSIMTGLSPLVHVTTKTTSRLPDSLKTLAEYMLRDGYLTVAIGYNPLLLPEFNLSQGFIEYDFFPRAIGRTMGPLLLKLLSKRFFNPFMPYGSTGDLTRLAIGWLRSNRERDFFLWIHYYDPHGPYTPPAEYIPRETPPPDTIALLSEGGVGRFSPPFELRKWVKGLYRGEVRYVDENIGRVIGALKSLGLYDRSLIVLTSDHGEEFWEHGGVDHGRTLYNEVIRVPLIIKPPRSFGISGRVNTGVTTQGVMPTVLDLCGIDYERGYLGIGSLSPLLKGDRISFGERPIMSTGLLYGEDMESVIFDGFKYIRSIVTGREELYDLSRDPGELFSILHLLPEKVRMARDILMEDRKIAEKLKEHYNVKKTERVRFDEETAEKLKALGYIR